MQRYQIQIKLRSDLCVSDGGVYNSAIDMDVCYDENGFPYIPAKRLKGCLREAALELKDWGQEIQIEKMFGLEGNQRGSIRIGNAYLRDSGEYEALANKYKGHMLLHPQNILGQFTYVRVQTSVDQETGAAEDNSLRSIRVIKKGCVLVAEVTMSDAQAMEEENSHSLELCCRVLRHMGISRTRGMGEVELTLRKVTENTISNIPKDEKDNIDNCEEQGNDVVEYEIYLHEPIICKSVNGEEENTMDYIEGGKILGLLVKLLSEKSNEEVQKLLGEKELKCSNAYLSDGKQRLLEVPASLYSVKNEKNLYADRIYPMPDADAAGEIKQLKPMKHCYVCWDDENVLHTRSVELQEDYHHRRPKDKSIGRAADENSGDSVFYQVSAIASGQKFRGYVMASAEVLQMIKNCIEQNPDITLGYGRSSEYGSASWNIVKPEKRKKIRKQLVTEFMVKLESPTILYSDKAAYTVDWHILTEEIEKYLNIPGDMVEERQKYINYTTVGGFQVTWGRRKPTLEAFDKGTVVYYKCKKPVEISVGETLWIGERCTEGYGETAIELVDKREDQSYYCQKITDTQDSDRYPKQDGLKKKVSAAESSFLMKLCRDKFVQYMYFTAGSNAWKDVHQPEWDKEALKPTVSNLLLMCSEVSNKQAVDFAAQERFKKKAEGKKDKENAWNQINKSVCEQTQGLLDTFMDEYGVEDFYLEMEEIEFLYLKEYLKQLKYALRHEKEVKKDE